MYLVVTSSGLFYFKRSCHLHGRIGQQATQSASYPASTTVSIGLDAQVLLSLVVPMASGLQEMAKSFPLTDCILQSPVHPPLTFHSGYLL